MYRFQYSGKWCSGDIYKSDNNASNSDMTNLANSEAGKYYLIFKGRYLLGLVIYVWVGGVGICCVACCVTAILMRKAG